MIEYDKSRMSWVNAGDDYFKKIQVINFATNMRTIFAKSNQIRAAYKLSIKILALIE
jgi:hypothetical protein